MKITREWLIENTKHGAPTREQLRVLGLDWPPKSGWIRELVGKEISPIVASAYVEAMNFRAKTPRTFLPPRAKEENKRWKFCPHCGKSLER